VDLSIGAVDEDVTYFGRRMITKAEIKKEDYGHFNKKIIQQLLGHYFPISKIWS